MVLYFDKNQMESGVQLLGKVERIFPNFDWYYLVKDATENFANLVLVRTMKAVPMMEGDIFDSEIYSCESIMECLTHKKNVTTFTTSIGWRECISSVSHPLTEKDYESLLEDFSEIVVKHFADKAFGKDYNVEVRGTTSQEIFSFLEDVISIWEARRFKTEDTRKVPERSYFHIKSEEKILEVRTRTWENGPFKRLYVDSLGNDEIGFFNLNDEDYYCLCQLLSLLICPISPLDTSYFLARNVLEHPSTTSFLIART